jgi:dinuclear metal center YbgI/SA1388 family protein
MVDLSELVERLDTVLETSAYRDASLNGLQVEASTHEVRRVAFAVDAGLSVIEQAALAGAQLLVVHHGLFWGEPERLVGPLARRVEALLGNGISLYASHLPLDGHLQLGHAATIAHGVGLIDVEGFALYKGKTIGARGIFRTPRRLANVLDDVAAYLGSSAPFTLSFGKETITSVAVATGSGSFAIPECARLGIDLLISGEPKHEAYHLCKELRCNAAFFGHYRTERAGLVALMDLVGRSFGTETIFLEEDSGI